MSSKQDSEYAWGPKSAKILNMNILSSKYGSVLSVRALHSVLNMADILTEFRLFLRILNMQELHKVVNIPQYVRMCLNLQ